MATTKESHKSPAAVEARKKLDAKVEQYLRSKGKKKPQTKKQIAEHLDVDTTLVKSSLSRLVKAGAVQSTGVTMNTTYAIA